MNIHREFAEWRASGFNRRDLVLYQDLAAFAAAVNELNPHRLSAEIGRYLADPATEESVMVLAYTPRARLVLKAQSSHPLQPLKSIPTFGVAPGKSWARTGAECFSALTGGVEVRSPRLAAILDEFIQDSPVAPVRRTYVITSVDDAFYLCGSKPGVFLEPVGASLLCFDERGLSRFSTLVALGLSSGKSPTAPRPLFHMRENHG